MIANIAIKDKDTIILSIDNTIVSNYCIRQGRSYMDFYIDDYGHLYIDGDNDNSKITDLFVINHDTTTDITRITITSKTNTTMYDLLTAATLIMSVLCDD